MNECNDMKRGDSRRRDSRYLYSAGMVVPRE